MRISCNACFQRRSCLIVPRHSRPDGSAGGYRFYFAVYVANVSPLTPVYMALIEPFRRFLVYPALLGNLRAAWVAAYPED